MDLALSARERATQADARAIAEADLAPGAAERDRSGAFPAEPMRRLAAGGFLAMLAPSERGGRGATALEYSLAIAEVARACASTSVTMAVTNMVADAIAHFGDRAQAERYVPRLADGSLVAGAFALSEPGAGSDAASLKSVAERRGDRYVLTGTKCWITSGDRAGVLLIMAKTDPTAGARGISAFLVDRGAKGLTVGRAESKMGLRASSTVTLHLDGVEVPVEARLGAEGEGFRIAMRALDGGRIGIGAQATGLHAACLEAAVRAAAEGPYADAQAVQWRLADLATELDAARLMVRSAASAKDLGRPFAERAAMAKVFATEAANRAALEALQLHGERGATAPVERYLRDVRVTMIYEGTSEVQRIVIARSLLKGA